MRLSIETVLLLIRHGLTAVGVWLVSRGLASQDDVVHATDATLTAVGTGAAALSIYWSWYRKWKRNPQPIPGFTAMGLIGLMGLMGMGCTLVSTTTNRKRVLPEPVAMVGTNAASKEAAKGTVVEEEVRTRAYSLFDSAQKIEHAKAQMTSTTQSAGFDGLDQAASTSNLFSALQFLGMVAGNAYGGHATQPAAPQIVYVTNYVSAPATTAGK